MLKEVRITTGLIIIFATAVLFIGGALSYFYYTDPNGYINSVDATLVRPDGDSDSNINSDVDLNSNNIGNWPGYTITDLDLIFHHPREWGSLALAPHNGDTGKTTNISFTESNVVMGYTSSNFTAGREGTFYEMVNINSGAINIKDCNTYKVVIGTESLQTCENVIDGDTIKGVVLYYKYPEDGMLTGPYTVGYYFTGNANYPVVGLEIADYSQALVDNFKNVIKSFATPSLNY